MHKRLLFIILLVSAFFVQDLQGQTVPVINGGFENWTDFSYPAPDVVPPTNKFNSSNTRSLFNYNDLIVTQVLNGGGSAMKLVTKSYVTPWGKDTLAGYAIWGSEPEGLGPGQPFPGGFPFSDQNVTGLKLDLKYSVNANSPGMVIVQFKKNGAIVGAGNGIMAGFYILPISGTQSSFTTVTLPISPALPFAPDTCVFAITSNNPDDKSTQYPGDFVVVDNISFTGTSQKFPGGDLDTWVNYIASQTLTNWNYADNEVPLKTTDAKSGNFAIQLMNIDRGGNPPDNIQTTRVSLGKSIYNPPSTYDYIPGTPLSGAPKSIGFYNKYTSPGLDTASVYVVLTKWDTNTKTRLQVGWVYDTIKLKSSYQYKYSTINYTSALTPDSAFIQFEASKRYPNAVAGSLLKIDDVAFHYCGEVLSITGSSTVCPSATGVTFSVMDTPNSTYTWNVPSGATIVAGNGTNSIKVNFGSTAGTVSVTKTYADGCSNTTANLNVSIQAVASANAGPDIDVCSNNSAQLNGSVTGASGGMWSGGAGIYSPNNILLNALYTPAAAEIAAGSVTLTLTTTGNGACVAGTDQVKLFFHKAPVSNAGVDQTLCANNATVSISGSVNFVTGGKWTSSGSGLFANGTSLSTTYTPAAADISAGNVVLTLTTTGQDASCAATNDQLIVTFTPAPTINAGPDITICANNSAVSLAGSVTIASGGIWSGGTGTFSPNNTTKNATYTPSASEIAAGSANLIFTTTGIGNCNAVSDQMKITINAAPVVNAGVDITVCKNNSTKTLNGSVTAPFGGVWSGGNGTFNPNATTLNASYTPSAAEIAAGSVTLTLTSTGNGNCLAVSDQMKITYTSSPTVNAGADLNLCSNNSVANLSGVVTVASGGIWSGGAGTFSPNITTLNASYTPTVDELTAGSVALTLTSSGNGNCNSVSDQVVINFTPSPFVYAGSDKTICTGSTATLSGTSTTSSGIWTSSGTGTFNNVNSFNATYTPSVSDRLNGNVTLTLTSAGNGNCVSVSDAMVITIQALPTSNAGVDQTICAGTNPVLNGVVTNASGGTWTSNGTGSFTPDNTTLNASYIPSPADVAAGTVTLTLTSTGNGSCSTSASDQVVMTFSSSAATANAGADKSLCNGADAILSGSVSGATGGTWTTSGSGSFDDANSLNAIYTPSAADVSAGTVTLILTTTGSGSCSSGSDNVVITYSSSSSIVAYAGADIQICTGEVANLNGSVTGANGGIWSSSGSGSFSPDPTTLDATYIPSSNDITAGSVSLTLTSTGNGSCNASSDVLTLSISSCTGVLSFEASDMKVYPSPSTSLVTIESKTGASIKQIRLMNAMQEEIDVKIIEMSSNNAVIDLTGLNAGMYFIQVSDDTKVSIKKIMKE